MKDLLIEFWKYILSGVIGAIIGLTITILYTRRFEIFFSKILKNRIGDKSNRDITGLWITQYKYPSMDTSGNYFEKMETQFVLFWQTRGHVIGKSVDAGAHPEVFEGRVTKDRYFTGVYINTINHQDYHGAFQFIISIGKGRMIGKWIGFDNKAINVNTGEWRWQQLNNMKHLSNEDLHRSKENYKDCNLFDDSTFAI